MLDKTEERASSSRALVQSIQNYFSCPMIIHWDWTCEFETHKPKVSLRSAIGRTLYDIWITNSYVEKVTGYKLTKSKMGCQILEGWVAQHINKLNLWDKFRCTYTGVIVPLFFHTHRWKGKGSINE